MNLERTKAGLGQRTVDPASVFRSIIELAGKGETEEAIRLLEAQDKAVRAHPVAQNLLSGLLLRVDRHRDALRAADLALRAAPNFAEAHNNRGTALHKLERKSDALISFDRALRLRPNYALAHFNRGVLLFKLGRPQDAILAYDAALKAQPDFPEVYLNRGFAKHYGGNQLEALADFDRALAMRPGYQEARVGRLQALFALNRTADAIYAADVILRDDPKHREARVIRFKGLQRLGRPEAALKVIDELIAEEPDEVELHTARAGILGDLLRFEDALEAADRAVAADPLRIDAHTCRAMACSELGMTEEALAACDAAERLGANSLEVSSLRAVAIGNIGQASEAIRLYERVLEHHPDNAGIRFNLSCALLYTGDFERGWAEYEERLRADNAANREYRQMAPAWTGEDISDKKLLVYCEQGLGDIIQFARYLRLIETRCSDITLVAPKMLHSLIRPGLRHTFVTEGLGLRTGFDFQVSLLSLAHVFRTTRATIPVNVPYLTSDPERVEKWRARLGTDGFKVGIIWQGNPKFRGDRTRSAALRYYKALADVPGVRLISLQASHGFDQLAGLPEGMKVEQLGPDVTNNRDGVAEIAGIMQNLDLVAMSDSGMAHLAGSLGRPIWVALQFNPDWRWLNEGSTNPWYPTMRLFRQGTRGDWPGVFSAMGEALAERVAAEKKPVAAA